MTNNALKQYIRMLIENESFDNWVMPDDKAIELEYNVEYKHHTRYSFGDIFPTVEDFKEAVHSGKQVKLTKEMDRSVGNRSRTSDMEDLRDLVSSYRSWPKYRNDETLQAIVDGFKSGSAMKMPFILEYEPGRQQVMSGNTRLDIAYMLGITPTVIVIKGYK